MCDCYDAQCAGCGRLISVHIGDFCIPRERLHVWCPACIDDLKVVELYGSASNTLFLMGQKLIFFEPIAREDQVEGYGIGSGSVLFVIDEPLPHGIHLN